MSYSYTVEMPGHVHTVIPLPVGVAKIRLDIAGFNTQCDALCKDSAGWIRQALVTSRIDSAGTFDVVADGPAPVLPPFTLGPLPQASLSFFDKGTRYEASLSSATVVFQKWSDGPLFKGLTYVIAPTSLGGVAHPLALVWFDLLAFKDGAWFVDLSLANGRNVPGIAAIGFSQLTATINNSVISAPREGLHFSGQVQWFQGSVGGYIAARSYPDSQLYYDAGAFLQYDSGVVNPLYDNTGAWQTPLQYADLTSDMSAGAWRAELGPQPQWAAAYLVHHGASQRARVFAAANLAGTYCGNHWGPDGTTTLRITDYTPDWNGPATAKSQFGALDPPHLPSLTVLAYYLSALPRYRRNEQNWASNVMFGLWNGAANTSERSSDTAVDFTRQGANAILASSYAMSPRGIAWGLNCIANAAFMTPDSEAATKAYFLNALRKNVEWLDSYAMIPGGGLFNPMFWQMDTCQGFGVSGYSVHTGYTSYSPWHGAYMITSLLRVRQMGIAPGNDNALKRTCMTVITLYRVAPKGENGTEDQRPRVGSGYYPRFGSGSFKGPHSMFTDWNQYYIANYMHAPDQSDFPSDTIPIPAGSNVYAAEYRLHAVAGRAVGLDVPDEMFHWFDQTWGGLNDARYRAGLAVTLKGMASPPPVGGGPPIVTPPTTTEQVIGKMRIRAAVLSISETDPNAGNNEAFLDVDLYDDIASTTLPPAPTPKVADVSVKVVSVSKAKLGQNFTVNYRCDNAGPDDATQWRGSLPTPEGAEYIQGSAVPSYGTITVEDGVPVWNINKLLAKSPSQGGGVTCVASFRAIRPKV